MTGEKLLQLLERRLDNVVLPLGFADTRAEARQLVRHGHFTVNGKRVEHPVVTSCAPGDEIEVREKSRKIDAHRRQRSRPSTAAACRSGSSSTRRSSRARVKALPAREDFTMPIREQLIVELYSK